MIESLDQSEVDAVMDAVRDDAPPGAAATLQIFSRCRRSFENVEITEYDFKRPERISKDQMRAIQTLHESFSRSLGASLSGFLRTIVEIRVARAEQMTYAEFISSLPNPTSFNLIDVPELDAQFCLEISPLVVYPVIDRLLGGKTQELFIPQREMTAIEIRLIQTVLSRAMTALTEAWEGIRRLEFTLGDMESNPHIVHIVPPNEVVVVVGFEIRMSGRAGTMSLCIPYKALEPLIDELSVQSWAVAGRDRSGARWRTSLAEHLGDARVDLVGVLATTTITMAELRRLEVGDVILTGRPARAPVIVEAAGRPKLLAGLGQYRGSRALRVIRRVGPEDRLD